MAGRDPDSLGEAVSGQERCARCGEWESAHASYLHHVAHNAGLCSYHAFVPLPPSAEPHSTTSEVDAGVNSEPYRAASGDRREQAREAFWSTLVGKGPDWSYSTAQLYAALEAYERVIWSER